MARALEDVRPLEWLLLAAGLFLVMHYAWLLDDAFVYFRYVDNWLFLSAGIVYNEGELVEGYSSPAWLLLLAALRGLHLDYTAIVRAVGAVSFVTFALLLVRVDRRLRAADRGEGAEAAAPSGAVALPLAYLAPCYGVGCYFTSGMETPLAQLLAPCYALFLLGSRTLLVDAALALSPLVRQELVLALAPALLAVALRERRLPWRPLLLSAGAGGGWLLFRIWYYADLFPNTYHLKDLSNVRQGLVYLADAARTYHLLPFVGLCLVLGLAARRAGSRLLLAPRLAMIAVALPVAAYVVRIGGDARHFRYLAFPFCLAVCASGGLLAAVRRRRLAVFAALAVAVVAGSAYPRMLSRHPFRYDGRHKLVDFIADAAVQRHAPSLGPERWARAVTPRALRAYGAAHPGGLYATTAMSDTCVLIYRRYDRRMIHGYGLTDAVLARMDVPVGRPGHKSALLGYAPDIVAIHERHGSGPGMYRRALESPDAPRWVRTNAAALDVIDRKVHNGHRLLENLGLALAQPRLTGLDKPVRRELIEIRPMGKR